MYPSSASQNQWSRCTLLLQAKINEVISRLLDQWSLVRDDETYEWTINYIYFSIHIFYKRTFCLVQVSFPLASNSLDTTEITADWLWGTIKLDSTTFYKLHAKFMLVKYQLQKKKSKKSVHIWTQLRCACQCLSEGRSVSDGQLCWLHQGMLPPPPPSKAQVTPHPMPKLP